MLLGATDKQIRLIERFASCNERLLIYCALLLVQRAGGGQISTVNASIRTSRLAVKLIKAERVAVVLRAVSAGACPCVTGSLLNAAGLSEIPMQIPGVGRGYGA
jgi:hypothetical protein